MATVRQKEDGDFFVVNGYPITLHGSTDLKFSAYEALPRANAFFQEASFRDGEQLDRRVFYLLLYEGDLTNRAVQGQSFSFDLFPSALMDCVHRLSRKPEIVSCLAGPEFRQCDSYLQFFRAFSTMPHEPAPMPATQSAPVISQKDYGIKYGLKGQA